ncbi:hypothetical protein PSHT_15884 [Puccinia striiformis]|uniref:Myb/SANT-like domain-containing protein n=1 Tax=Puccinia striiformis TaxID=27350 RepID=A0A2S4UCL9_9BASI|nr:hypothetical protein PSHT_15884 [Puccinia striiformis]
MVHIDPTLFGSFSPSCGDAQSSPNTSNPATVLSQPSDVMSQPSSTAAPPPAPLVTTSTAPAPPATKPKRTRRTKAQMALARQQGPPTPPTGSSRANRTRSRRGRGGRTGAVTQPARRTRARASQTNAAQSPTGSTEDETDWNPQFILTDFQNICSYLEDKRNYAQLYGSGSQTEVGPRAVTKAAAYEMFAVYINDRSASRLSLTGKQLRQRIDAYKKKFVAAKNWMDNTGAGIEEGEYAHTLPALIEEKCPCYDRMDAIFGAKPNVTPLAQYEPQGGMDLYGFDINEDPDDDDRPPPESPEVFYRGWSQTQRSDESSQNINHGPSLLSSTPGANSSSLLSPTPGPPAPEDLSSVQGLESRFRLDFGALLSSTMSSPGSTQVGGNENHSQAGGNVAPAPTESTTGDSAPPGPTCTNAAAQPARTANRPEPARPANHPEPAQPTNGPEPTTNTNRFPNQAGTDRLVPAPRRDSGQANKGKSSIAAAFEASTEKKFEYLDKHMAMEKEKFSWEKEKYGNEREAALDRSNVKKAAAEQWLLEGRSVAEVEALMRAIYGV